MRGFFRRIDAEVISVNGSFASSFTADIKTSLTANLILKNFIGRDFTRVAARYLHTIQWQQFVEISEHSLLFSGKLSWKRSHCWRLTSRIIYAALIFHDEIFNFHPLTNQKEFVDLLTDNNKPPKSFSSASNNFVLLVSAFSRSAC